MIEIFVNNQKVDLPADIQLSLTIENPMLLSDRIPSPYSLSFTLPPTANNLSIFRHPNREASFKNAAGTVSSVPCRILFNSLTIAQGSLITSEYDGSIKAAFSGIDNINSIKKMLANVPLGVLEYPTTNFRIIDFDNASNYAGKYKLMADQAAAGNDPRFVVAPVRMQTDNDPVEFIRWTTGRLGTRPVYLSPQRMMDSEYVNFFNPQTGEFMIRSTELDLRRNLWYAYHAPIFPFIRVHYMLETIFGESLVNNVFAQGEFADLVIPSTYFSNWKERGVGLVSADGRGAMMFDPFTFDLTYAVDFTLTLSQFMPSIEAPEWFKELLKLFCISVYNKFGRFEIVLNKDVLAAPVSLDWESKLIRDPILSIEKGKIYKYGYEDAETFSPADNVVQVTTMNAMLNMPSTDPGEELVTVFHVAGTDQYFERTIIHEEGENTSDPGTVVVTFRLLSAGYGGMVEESESSETYDAVSAMKPLPLMPKEYWTSPRNMPNEQPPAKYWFMVPYSESDRSVRPNEAPIGFFRGMVDAHTAGHTYPLISPYNIDPDGTQNGGMTLCWEGANGLLDNFHQEFKEWVEKDKLRLRGTFHLTEIDLNKLDLKSKVHVRGNHFFIDKIQVTIRHNRIDPAVIDLIEA